ncbi:short chain dehydrogenase [Galdieria sulphuraria]|uniref:Short chain dehydrogenase n=1 Tax=Galdieria sulphuraria TaxID=130081 RepID=M2W0X9_GALSU|nr:short chain dehydrogenase [Galdieria sulphuraria]EME29271.1 short chain dehydrogenase [Galdieria sulphuraria]|eukprot:XP_005705791.1 short chain dehydrogenase [Galdieria sulphuraria]
MLMNSQIVSPLPIHSVTLFFADMWILLGKICTWIVFLLIGTYLLPLIWLTCFCKPQDLKRKYGATWALVTGASQGIGRAIASKLSSQGLNVVLVAIDDDQLETAKRQLKAEFPRQEFRSVGVDLSVEPHVYMNKIMQATEDIVVQVVFNNAGYLSMGFFRHQDVEKLIGNLECNALSAIRITHHFMKRMIEHGCPGCICFTASAVSFLPSPFASMYGASKALLSHFAASLAVEARDNHIDIVALHPSYTRTHLYANTPKLLILNFLDRFAATPEEVAEVLIHSAGRVILRDTGGYAVITKLISRIVDMGVITYFMMIARKWLPEYRAFSKKA